MICYCKHCLIPNTRPGTVLDGDGLCQPCASRLNSTSTKGKEEKDSLTLFDDSHLEKLMSWAVDEARKHDSNYDCLIPVSGGKDSIFQVEMALRYGLRVAAVNAVPLARSELRAKNMDTLRAIGADVFELDIKRPWRVVLSRTGFLKIGVPNWPQHVLSVTVPFHLAMNLGIKLILWGENPEAEYGGPEDLATRSEMTAEWFARRSGADGLQNAEMEDLTGLPITAEPWFHMPTDLALKQSGTRAAFLGQYTRWSSFRSWFVAMGVGFSSAGHPPQNALWPFENLDDPLYLLHDWLKYLKFGFGRCTDHVSLSIREGLLSRNDGARIIGRLEGLYPRQYLDWSIENLLTLLEIDKSTFDKTSAMFANPALFELDQDGRLVIENNRVKRTPAFAQAQDEAGIVIV